MKSRILRCANALALLAALSTSFPLCAQTPAGPSHYVVIDLGTLGGTDAGGSSINNRGWVSGMSIMAGNQTTHAALWINGAKIDLGTLPGGANSAIAWPIKNEHGVLVGFSETGDVNPLGERFSCPSFFLGVPRTGHSCQGFKWENNAMTPLPRWADSTVTRLRLTTGDRPWDGRRTRFMIQPASRRGKSCNSMP